MENAASLNAGQSLDRESEISLKHMAEQEQALANRISGVKFVLVVLSSKGMVFDLEALRQKIVLSYPDSAVFYQTTAGKPIGPAAPERVDLLIDFSGPGQRQGFFYARTLRKKAKFAIGRNAGFFRKKIYNRVFDETSQEARAAGLPTEQLEKERFVQKKLLNLAGIAFVPAGDTHPDRGKSIALELPGMRNL